MPLFMMIPKDEWEELVQTWQKIHRRLARQTFDEHEKEWINEIAQHLGSGNQPSWEDKD